ncbi:MAG: tetratricopeptide repeat protein [Methanoregula sp.]
MEARAEKHFDKGADFAKLGDLEKAIALFDKALVLEPENDMVWVLRGSLLNELCRYSDALTSYDKALAIRPDYDVAWYNRGTTLRKLGRFTDAVTSFDKALAINPAYPSAKKDREMALQERDNSPCR